MDEPLPNSLSVLERLPFRIQMLLFIVALFLSRGSLSIETVILTTDEQVILYNGQISPEFVIKDNNFDCSLYLYAYAQPQQDYYRNSPIQLSLSSVKSDLSVWISTVYSHFSPSLSVDLCLAPACLIDISHNCPLQLNSENYFDIVQMSIQDIGTFSYYLRCDKQFNAKYFEWGQFVISACATVVLIFATIFARFESFSNSGIEYNLKWIIFICAMIFGVGMMTLYAPQAASVFLDVVSWIVSPVCVGIVALQIPFLFRRYTCVDREWWVGRVRIRLVDILSLSIGLGLTFLWWFTQKNWIVSDIISICIIISIIKVFKFVSLKIAVLSYVVVVSLFILGVILPEVTKGEESTSYFIGINNPFQFQIPTISPTYNLNCSWVAITSISFPGLLIAYLHRFDKSRSTNIYMISTIVAYFFGAILWNIVNAISRYPIPFDGVCEPFMILTLIFMAFNRKQLRTIWDGTFYDEEFVNKKEIELLGKSLEIEMPEVDQLEGHVFKSLLVNVDQYNRQNNQNPIKANLIPKDQL